MTLPSSHRTTEVKCTFLAWYKVIVLRLRCLHTTSFISSVYPLPIKLSLSAKNDIQSNTEILGAAYWVQYAPLIDFPSNAPVAKSVYLFVYLFLVCVFVCLCQRCPNSSKVITFPFIYYKHNKLYRS